MKTQRRNSDQLLELILERISKGEWSQGSRLPGEIEMAGSFEVSRNIMREALRSLENFGIIESRNGVGTFVSPNAIENIQSMIFFNTLKNNASLLQILELRLMIEPDVAYLAAIRAKPDDVARLQQVMEQLRKRFEEDPSYQDDFELHRAIAHCSGNQLCEELCTSLLSQLQHSHYAEFNKYASQSTKEDNLRTHLGIVEAIVASNPPLAREMMRAHLLNRINLIAPSFETFAHDKSENRKIYPQSSINRYSSEDTL